MKILTPQVGVTLTSASVTSVTGVYGEMAEVITGTIISLSPSRCGCIPSDFLREPSNLSNVVGVSLLSEHLKGLPVLASDPVTLLIHSFEAAVYMSLTKARIRLNSKQQQDGPYQQLITHRYNELQHCRNITLCYTTSCHG